jgi:hypothetical protein
MLLHDLHKIQKTVSTMGPDFALLYFILSMALLELDRIRGEAMKIEEALC